MALIANTQRSAKHQRAFRPGDFDPFARNAGVMKADVSVLKEVFVEGRVPGMAVKASQPGGPSRTES
ncbi:MAG: hypothetical protein IT430_19245 [Phycisphaerales bacterium]|nr:hypothetical protein [Phycisphaerales bacterium]